MKLKFKVISIVVAFTLIIGLLFLFSDIEQPEEEQETSPTLLQDRQAVLFWSEADFNEIHLMNEDEENEIILVKNEQGNWDTAKPLAEKVNLNKIDQAVSIIFSLSAHSKEVEITTDEVFIPKEERSITLLNQSGITEKLTIGHKNNDGSFYYVKLLDSEEIYQVPAQLIDILPSSQEDLFDRSVVQITSQQVRNINISNHKQTIKLAPISPFTEEEVRTNLSGWYMHEPYRNIYPVKYNSMSEMVYGMKDIEWLEIVDESGEKLEEYGLKDVDFQITFGSDEEEETILIGAPATNQSYYAKLAEEDDVFTVNQHALHPYRFQAFDLIEDFVKKIALDVLIQLNIQTDNEEYLIVVDRNDIIDNEYVESSEIYTINEQQIDDEIFRELYEEISGLSVDQEVEHATYTTPEVTMSYTIADGDMGETEIVVELVNYDKENYAVFLEGQADFLVEKEKVIQMIESIEGTIE